MREKLLLILQSERRMELLLDGAKPHLRLCHEIEMTTYLKSDSGCGFRIKAATFSVAALGAEGELTAARQEGPSRSSH